MQHIIPLDRADLRHFNGHDIQRATIQRENLKFVAFAIIVNMDNDPYTPCLEIVFG
jgi:hypothetical protein